MDEQRHEYDDNEAMDLGVGADNDNDSISSSGSSSSSNTSSSSSSSSTTNVLQMLDQLANNDPDLTSLNMSTFGSAGDWDWGKIGLDIGMNTELNLVSFHHIDDLTQENYKALLRGLSWNGTITDIDFLHSNLLGGWIFSHLIPTFERLCLLTIEDCDLGPEGSLLLSHALESCRRSRMVEINFDRIGSGGLEIVHVIRALKVHSQLEKISLRGNNIGTSACAELSSSLLNRNNNNKLIALDLGENIICEEGAALLASGLKRSTTTHLNLGSNPSLGSHGFEAFAILLQSPCSRLKSLSLNDTVINEETSINLANSLVSNNTLTDLYLDNTKITFRGLQAFSFVLQSPQSRLKHISLCNNKIKDRGAILFANSLVNNSKLVWLDLSNDVSITTKGWKAFSRLLCRRSSIMDTYNSNHTLQKFHDDEWVISGDLMLLLLMNREDEKRNVARQKIIKYHFCGNFDMQPFVGMELGALSHVIAWMGRDEIPLLYQFVRNMQSFFNFSNGVKVDDGSMTKRQKVHPQPVVPCPTAYIGDWWHEKP